MKMTGDPPENVEWRAFGALLQEAQKRLGHLESQSDLIQAGVQLLHDDLLTSRSEMRIVSNRLRVVETTMREVENAVRETGEKVDLILSKLGLGAP